MVGPWELTKSGLGLTLLILCVLGMYYNLQDRSSIEKKRGFCLPACEVRGDGRSRWGLRMLVSPEALQGQYGCLPQRGEEAWPEREYLIQKVLRQTHA